MHTQARALHTVYELRRQAEQSENTKARDAKLIRHPLSTWIQIAVTQVVLGLQPHLLLHPPDPSSVLLGKRFISRRSSVECGPCCKQRLLDEVTVSGLKAIQADPFQGSYQLGQSRAKLPFVLAHQRSRV